MPRKRTSEREYQLGDCWLWLRDVKGTPIWCVCWYDEGARTTRRKSTGIRGHYRADGTPAEAPKEAIDELTKTHLDQTKHDRRENTEVFVEDVLWDYYDSHGRHQAAETKSKVISPSLRHFSAFLALESKSGRISGAAVIDDLRPTLIRNFHKWRSGPHSYKYKDDAGEIVEFSSNGVSFKTADTNSDYVRAALKWAWKEGMLQSAPFIPSVDKKLMPGPRERILTTEEIASLFEAAYERVTKPPRPSKRDMVYLMIAFASGGRPEAICDLHSSWCIDRDRWLLDMNEPGRPQTRKIRPVIPICRHLMPWISDIDGWLISKEKTEDGQITQPYGVARIRDNKKSFANLVKEAGLKEVSRITIRHTVSTILRERGVDEWEADGFTGHASKSTTGKSYAHFRPDYLSSARKALDEFFEDLTKHTKAHLRYTNDTPVQSPKVLTFRK